MDDPWQASSLEDFHFYCCPECPDVKHHAKELFVKHALDLHPKAATSIEQFLIKTEIHEFEFEENDNYDNDFHSEELDQFSNTDIIKEEIEEVQNVKKDPESENIYYNIQNDENTIVVDDPNAENLRCKSCGKIFTNRVNLDDHFATVHEGLRKHPCDFCEKAFGYKSNLSIHIKMAHGGEKLRSDLVEEGQKIRKKVYASRIKDKICKFCGIAYASKKSLEKHIEKSHNGAENGIPIENDDDINKNFEGGDEVKKEEKIESKKETLVIKNEKKNNNTYKKININEKNIINKHKSYMKKYKINIDENMMKLPNFYAMPKMHKKIPKMRYIAASNRLLQNNYQILLQNV